MNPASGEQLADGESGKGKGKSGKWASRSDSSATFALFFRPLLPAAAPQIYTAQVSNLHTLSISL